MSLKSVEYCMERKCKTCERSKECGMLNITLHQRLMWKPFENLKEVLEKRNDKQKNSLCMVGKRQKE